ncbi:MAG: Spy/CpxP family protein refolding chaperone [Stigonema ocellatum SAG 48.90 = DSM 106950]|nr:Spy/CpxP family protein refolding chaperone [Stigonema ocellatum SAG 48.90 = DSM 106950]
MKCKLDFKPILGVGAIAILVAGCQLSSPHGAVSPNNSTENATNSSATPTAIAQVSAKIADLNLTDAQKAQMKQIREETQRKIVGILSSDQQKQFKDATQGNHKLPIKLLFSLNLSAEQKQKVRELLRAQRQKIQAILTPEQQAKIKQHRPSTEQSSSN